MKQMASLIASLFDAIIILNRFKYKYFLLAGKSSAVMLVDQTPEGLFFRHLAYFDSLWCLRIHPFRQLLQRLLLWRLNLDKQEVIVGHRYYGYREREVLERYVVDLIWKFLPAVANN
ncbi:MAG: hypothetical protein J7L69_04960 [Desulfobulbaceae bacterium]|nr:hypothetical protein [Desulfobulbaceae bacterium]